MKTLKSLLLIAAVAFAVLFPSCENGETPDYVGTWVAYQTIMEPDDFKLTMALEEDYFTFTMALLIEDVYVDYEGYRGPMDVDGNNVTATVMEVYGTEDDITYQWYGPGDDVYDDWLDNNEGDNVMEGTYSVDGNTLTMIMEGDPMIFTKQ
jgi:hypothetical protein